MVQGEGRGPGSVNPLPDCYTGENFFILKKMAWLLYLIKLQCDIEESCDAVIFVCSNEAILSFYGLFGEL